MQALSLKRRAEAPIKDAELMEDSSGDSISSDSEVSSEEDEEDEEEEDEENKEDVVIADFEFFDPQEQDFLGIKHLLRQLFDTDAELFDLDELTELILAQPLLGSTVKTDGHLSDPLSVVTVLNLRTNKAELEMPFN
jgi:protein BCP1